MTRSLILASVFAATLGLLPAASLAQTDQTTTAPMATATVNPVVTAAPETSTSTATTTNSNTGWWGLIGLVGLLGLFGTRRDRTTTIT